ncbi:hypothetical protein GS429_03060 [Natronorubrum sp. JWXQ-INN-674]|uniref:DUF7847 domain-containing protein n=1 Tax=Natronorubrum halalkaliphilum TaxID=2691917 RepID=A0A6B0VIE6_9EURY|nr:hypothetical protein [Natronorubrum halalkaliphilum]MXV61053.1 hypothetical protein [Natronorubrum halalkaliphilum]
MSFRVSDALTGGIERTLAKNGLVLAAAFYVLLAVQTLFTPSGVQTGMEPEPIIDAPVIGGLISVLTSLAGLYLLIVALRTFVTDETETIPDAALRNRPVWAFLNVFVGLIIFTLLVAIGFVFLIVPGLFLLVALWFFDVYVAVEDDDFVTAMKRSWSLTSGNRLGLFGLGVGVVLITIAISIPFTIAMVIVGGVLGVLISQIGTAIGGIFVYATTAVAFTQLRDSKAGVEDRSETDDWGSSTDDEWNRSTDR